MISYWKYSTSMWVNFDTSRRGNCWHTCVDDGELSFLDHHVASICDLFARPEHLQEPHWTSGPPCLSSFMAIFPQHQAWTTPLLRWGVAVAYVKSTSGEALGRNRRRSWQRCGGHFRRLRICSLGHMTRRSFPTRSWADLHHVYNFSG